MSLQSNDTQRLRLGLVGLMALLAYSPNAWGHTEEGVAGGLVSGLLHPVLGADHLVAMVAVGLWGAQLGAPALWTLPITFPIVMAAGALGGLVGMALPLVEVGVAVSAVGLGMMVALALRPPIWVAAALVGVFGIFHGHAHGTEIPSAANPLAYAVGFVVATGLLHLAGIVLGILVKFPVGKRLVKICGLGVATVGMFFLGEDLGLYS